MTIGKTLFSISRSCRRFSSTSLLSKQVEVVSTKSSNAPIFSEDKSNKIKSKISFEKRNESIINYLNQDEKVPEPISKEIESELTSLFSQYHQNPTIFRMKPFVNALQILSKDIDQQNFQLALQIAYREGALWPLRDILNEIATRFKDELISDVNIEKLKAMNSINVESDNSLVKGWGMLAEGNTSQLNDIFRASYSDLTTYDYNDASLHEWLQILSLAGEIQIVQEAVQIFKKQLDRNFDTKNFKLDENSRKNYFQRLQKYKQYEFDAYYELALKSLNKAIESGEKIKSTTDFVNWYNFLSENYFFKSLKYNQVKDLKIKSKRLNKDENVQEYYKDLVPSTYVFTKTIILLSKFERWEEAAYIYNEARKRTIGMRPVTFYAEEFNSILPKLQIYISFGHVDPMKINLGRLFDFKNQDKEFLLNRLSEAYKERSL